MIASTTVTQSSRGLSLESFDEFKLFIQKNFIEGSGISQELFDACVEFHEDLENNDGHDASTPIHDELGWDFTRFGHKANERLFAAFLKNEDGSIWQAVVSAWDDDKQRPYRYFAPKGAGDKAFLPPIPPNIRKRIGNRYGIEVPMEGSFWDWVKEIDLPRILTEGGKKALCGLSNGYVAIALYGCTCGAKSKDEQDRHVDPYLIPDLEQFAGEGSKWLFALDRDEKQKAKLAVGTGKKKLRLALTATGCLTTDIMWKAEEGKGMDDFVVNNGGGAFDLAYQNAIAKLEKQFQKKDSKKGGIPPADIIAAELFEKYKDRLIWNDDHKTWMEYELEQPGSWSAVSEHYVESGISTIIEAMGISGYGSPKYKSNIVGNLLHKMLVRKWVENPDLLPFTDGVLNLKTGEFSKHSPANKLTWCLPRPYNLPAVCTSWNKINDWLIEATGGNKEDVQILIHFAAAVLRGRSDLQKFLHLIGGGGSGKSTYTRLIESLVGIQNCWNGSMESLEDKHEVIKLMGKRAALFPDQDKTSGKMSNFKRMTGQDSLSGRRLYKDGIDFKFPGLAILTSNFPIFQGIGSWLKRRILMVAFNNTPSYPRDLDAEFEPELSSFTKYLISIPDEEITRVLRGTSNEMNPTLWESAVRQDSIAAWLNEWVIKDETAITQIGCDRTEWEGKAYNPQISTLFGSYTLYCRQSGLQAKGKNNFSADLIELCKQTLLWQVAYERCKVTGKRCVRGLRLRSFGDNSQTIDEILTTYRQPTDNLPDNLEPLLNNNPDNPDNLLTKISVPDSNLFNERSQVLNNSDLISPHTSCQVVGSEVQQGNQVADSLSERLSVGLSEINEVQSVPDAITSPPPYTPSENDPEAVEGNAQLIKDAIPEPIPAPEPESLPKTPTPTSASTITPTVTSVEPQIDWSQHVGQTVKFKTMSSWHKGILVSAEYLPSAQFKAVVKSSDRETCIWYEGNIRLCE